MTRLAEDASAFYTGLVAELYELLLSERSNADDYVPFLEAYGTPALELACGSGLPMVELIRRGHAVEGLDSSEDMLDRCRRRTELAGVEVVLHHAPMQSFDLGRRFRSVFIAAASFTLLTSDTDARRCLACIADHLEPGGSVLITLERVDPAEVEPLVGRFREARDDRGRRVRFGLVGVEAHADGRTLIRRLRYERTSDSGEVEAIERDWVTRWFPQDLVREMLVEAGFGPITFLRPQGGRAAPDAPVYVALARRSRDSGAP